MDNRFLLKDCSKYKELIKLSLAVGQVSGCLLTLGVGAHSRTLARNGLCLELTEDSQSFLINLMDQSRDEELIIQDVDDLSAFSEGSAVGFRFFACLPIRDNDGGVLGVLSVIDDETKSLNEAQLEGLRGVAKLASGLLKCEAEELKVEAALETNNPLYFAFNSEFKIVSFPETTKKLFKGNIQINKNLKEIFILPENFSLVVGGALPNRYFNLETLDLKMKFTCNYFKCNDLIYTAFTPVVNTRYPLVNYDLSIPEMSGLNHLGEYIFLRETTNISINDYDKISQTLSAKNKELTIKNSQIEQSEKSYKKLFDGNMAGVFVIKLSGEYLRVNKSYSDIYGWDSPQDFRKYKFSDFFVDKQYLDDYLRRLEDGKELRNHLIINKNLSGEIIYLMLNSTIDFDEVRNENIISGTLIDVTEIINSQKKIRTQVGELKRLGNIKNELLSLSDNLTKHMSLDRLLMEGATSVRELFKLVNVRIFNVDASQDKRELTLISAEQGKFNQSEAAQVGVVCRVEEDSIYSDVIQNKNPFYLSGDKDLNSFFADSVINLGIFTDLEGVVDYMLSPLEHDGSVVYLVECFSKQKTGTADWREVSSFLHQFNLLVSRTLLNKEVGDNERKWRSLVENSSEITCVVDGDCVIQYMSKSSNRLFGIPAEEYAGKKMLEIIHPDDIPEAATCFTQTLALESGEENYHVLRFRTRTGHYLYMRVSAQLSRNEAYNGCVIINAQNITELIEAENSKYSAVLAKEEEERKRISEDLHDGVGQHLAACVMYSNVLGRIVNEQLDENAVKIYEKTKGLLEIAVSEVRGACHDIMPPSIEQIGFRESIMKLIDDLDASNPHLEVEYREEYKIDQISPDVSLSLYRGVQQLLSNALKHGKPDRIEVVFKEQNEFLIISVKDNGVGFNMQTAHMQQGIGLNSIKNRVQVLGGKLEVDSEEGNGAVLNMVVPKGAL